MPPDSIGIIPHNGYTPKLKQSDFALTWLDWLNEQEREKRPVTIHHLGHGTEKMIGPHHVDGWNERERIAYEIQ